MGMERLYELYGILALLAIGRIVYATMVLNGHYQIRMGSHDPTKNTSTQWTGHGETRSPALIGPQATYRYQVCHVSSGRLRKITNI